jgi:hypothetical protein
MRNLSTWKKRIDRDSFFHTMLARSSELCSAPRHTIALAFVALISVGLSTHTIAAKSANGFLLDNLLLPQKSIVSGGPPRDGIPAINKPNFSSTSSAKHMRDNDRVLGVDLGEDQFAFPLYIMNWHEVVNLRHAGSAVLVSYCPLCGTGVAYHSHVRGRDLSFGVSGLLYNSDVLFYDRETNSLWSQLMSKSISGAYSGTQLKSIPMEHTTWLDWKMRYPGTTVLNEDQGYKRAYRDDPYRGYTKTQHLFFKVAAKIPDTYHRKEYVLGIEIAGKFKAYPFSELESLGKTNFEDQINGQRVKIHWDAEHTSARAYDANGNLLAGIVAFWFAWYAFHPDTSVFKAPLVI